MKTFFLIATAVFVLASVPLAMAQTAPVAAPSLTVEQQIASAVLPLPEDQRATATVMGYGPDQKPSVVLRKGSSNIVCTADRPGDTTFYVNCFDQAIFRLLNRTTELSTELKAPGNSPAVNQAIEKEIKEGKFTLPTPVTMGFQMRGPLSGYDPKTNSTTSAIINWQMVIMPHSTGASLGLPTEPKGSMPWVMDSGTWLSHIMVQHAPEATR
jgi:hypothetical protein